MISILDCKAYVLKIFFGCLGWFGALALNFGRTKGLDMFSNVQYGPESDQCLDVLRLKSTTSASLPLLVYFHGGGWISADKKIYQGIAATFSKKGFLTFNVNYRLAPKSRFTDTLRDATRALRWIRLNASRYGGDCSAVVLAGDSAGAQIASWYASALQDRALFDQIGITVDLHHPPLKGLALFYGVYDFDTVLNARFPFIRVYARSFLGADSGKYEVNSKLASPVQHVSSALPPMWLCAGERDGLFAQSQAYAEALKNCGAPCRTLFFPLICRASHGFLFFWWLASSKIAVASATAFLQECVETTDQAKVYRNASS